MPKCDFNKVALYLSVFSPNAGKYGPEKTPYLDTFHAVKRTQNPVKHLRWSFPVNV